MANEAGGKGRKGGKKGENVDVAELEARVHLLELQAREAEAKVRAHNAKAALKRNRGAKDTADDE